MILSAADMEAQAKETKQFIAQNPGVPLPVNSPRPRATSSVSNASVRSSSPAYSQGGFVALGRKKKTGKIESRTDFVTPNPAASPPPEREPEYDGFPLFLNPDTHWRYSTMHLKPANNSQVELQGPILMNRAYNPSSSHAKAQSNDVRKPPLKKTRRVFPIPNEELQKRREERKKWVLEDTSDGQEWVGDLQDDGDGYVAFQKCEHNGHVWFLMTPLQRAYAFHPKSQVSKGKNVDAVYEQYTTALGGPLSKTPYMKERTDTVAAKLIEADKRVFKKESSRQKSREKHRIQGFTHWAEKKVDDTDLENIMTDDEEGDGCDDLAEVAEANNMKREFFDDLEEMGVTYDAYLAKMSIQFRNGETLSNAQELSAMPAGVQDQSKMSREEKRRASWAYHVPTSSKNKSTDDEEDLDFLPTDSSSIPPPASISNGPPVNQTVTRSSKLPPRGSSGSKRGKPPNRGKASSARTPSAPTAASSSMHVQVEDTSSAAASSSTAGPSSAPVVISAKTVVAFIQSNGGRVRPHDICTHFNARRGINKQAFAQLSKAMKEVTSTVTSGGAKKPEFWVVLKPESDR